MSRRPTSVLIRTRRIWLAMLFALGIEIVSGVFFWRMEQWRLPILAAIWVTLLLAMGIGLILAGERWKIVGDFRVRHPTISIVLITGVATAIVFGLVIGPAGIIIGPLVLGFLVLAGLAVRKTREFVGL